MVKLRGPMFSLEAHGSIGNCLTYQDINGWPCAKSLRFMTYRRSDAQAVVRDIFAFGAQLWNALHDPKKDKWNAYKDYLKLTGYKSFISYYLKRSHLALWQFELPPSTGFCITGNHNVADFIAGGGIMLPV